MFKKIYMSAFVLLVFYISISAQNIYVSVDGNDLNTGAIDSPLKSLTTAISKIGIGDTIYMRGGEYLFSSTISISSSKSGNENQKYFLFGYKNERPLLNFAATSNGTKGMKLNASYWHIKGLDITKAGHNAIGVTGSFNIIEHCTFFENRNSGLQLDNGAAYNKIINCDSYFNYDAHNQGADADGFAPKLTVGTGNYFYGCRAWTNSDDGWDGYLRGANDMTTTLENCWTWGNGYAKTGFDPGSQANGNGFKMGGSDDKNLAHNFILKNCLAFDNKSKGFDQNSNKGSMTLYNCTSYRNKGNNYALSSAVASGKTITVINCAALGSYGAVANIAIQQTNSWMSPFLSTEDDFISIDTTGISGPRNEDGSLPNIEFMHLVFNSDLVDAGTDVGLTFAGSKPDLGAFEFGLINSVEKEDAKLPEDFRLSQNYPNPFNPSTKIEFSVPTLAKVVIDVFDILGKKVVTLVDEEKPAGKFLIEFNAHELSSGIYFLKMSANGNVLIKKMQLLK